MDNQIYFWAHMLDEAFGANDTLLTEGDHWPEDYFRKLASKTNDEIAKKFVIAFDPRAFDGDSTHRFSNTLISYFNTVVKWMLQSGIQQDEFISTKLPTVVNFLKALESDKVKEKELRAKIKAMSLQDFENFMQEFAQQKIDDEASKLAQQSFSNEKQYDVIKITSYRQMNKLFGGLKTGNPKEPKSAWCHTNGENTYDTWISKNGGPNVFFVIASKDWRTQRYPENPMNALDKYGSSLCAILVDLKGNLLNSTLRYNHKCEVKGRSADSAFADWADLNQFYGQDIRSEVLAQMNEEISKAETEAKAMKARLDTILANVTEINNDTIPCNIKNKITSIVIPRSVTIIGDNAFDDCKYIKNITIPNSVTSIGKWAFYNCTSLTSITIPGSVTSIGDRAFYCCHSLTSVTIPDLVTRIGKQTFSSCYSLTSITISDSVIRIDAQAFVQCESLKSVIIPNSVKDIGDGAFSYCKSLTSITIPDSVKRIGHAAFAYCKSLTSITIQGSVTSIGEYAFAQCPSLKNIIVPDQNTADIVLQQNQEAADKIVIKPMSETKKFSRKQIKEAIAYWESQLK